MSEHDPMKTKLGAEAILERMNVLHEETKSLHAETWQAIAGLQTTMDALQNELNEFRLESIRALKAIERRMDIFAADSNTIRADMKDFDLRLADVESKVLG